MPRIPRLTTRGYLIAPLWLFEELGISERYYSCIGKDYRSIYITREEDSRDEDLTKKTEHGGYFKLFSANNFGPLYRKLQIGKIIRGRPFQYGAYRGITRVGKNGRLLAFRLHCFSEDATPCEPEDLGDNTLRRLRVFKQGYDHYWAGEDRISYHDMVVARKFNFANQFGMVSTDSEIRRLEERMVSSNGSYDFGGSDNSEDSDQPEEG